MLKEERQQKILEILYHDGQVNVESLSKHFSISKDTIRRDLTELETQKLVKRSYGGAIPYKELPLNHKDSINTEDDKYKTARKALEYIVPDSLIAIDGGTTNTLLTSLIPHSMKLTVVTNSFTVHQQLCKHPHIRIIFLGGECLKSVHITSGEGTFHQLSHFHFDACFIGVNAVNAYSGMSIVAPFEKSVSLKRYIIENSDEVYIMSDHSKFDQVTNYILCSLDDVTRIITDKPTDPYMNKRYLNKVVYEDAEI